MSAAIWAEDDSEAHPGLGHTTMQPTELAGRMPRTTDAHDRSMLPPRPPAPAHELRIRVYDYCRKHGPHTDPDLAAIEAGL